MLRFHPVHRKAFFLFYLVSRPATHPDNLIISQEKLSKEYCEHGWMRENERVDPRPIPLLWWICTKKDGHFGDTDDADQKRDSLFPLVI